MNYLHPPERLDALARSHALGTLSPRASRRFARVLATSPDAAEAVARWRDVLGTLELGVPSPVDPREAVWESVRARLFEPAQRLPARAAGAPDAAPTPGKPRARAAAGRSWASGLGGLLLGLVLLGAAVVWRPNLLGVEPTGAAAPQAYVGVLLDGQGRPALSTIARRHGRVLTVRALSPQPLEAGQQFVLWAWNGADPTPHALASWMPPAGAATTVEVQLPADAEAMLGKMTSLGATREPRGAMPAQPGGPFFIRGACAKVW